MRTIKTGPSLTIASYLPMAPFIYLQIGTWADLFETAKKAKSGCRKKGQHLLYYYMGKSKNPAGKKNRSDTGKAAKTDPRKRRLIVFVLTFLGILLVGAIIYPHFSIYLAEELRGFMAITAHICGGILSLAYDDVTVSDRYISFRGFSVEIIEECTGIFEMLIFLAALISYPASWKSKLAGILCGLPALYLFNVIRIIVLTVVGVYNRRLFDFMHLYFWQATLILMITTVWVLWILLAVSREKKSAALFS